MKNRKWICLSCFVVMLALLPTLLTGCQLAKETGSDVEIKDEMCGLFITLGTEDAMLKAPELKSSDITINSKGEPVIRDDASVDQNIVEGKLSEDECTIKFEGLKGYFFGSVYQTNASREPDNTFCGDKGLTDLNFKLNQTDQGEIQSSEATLSVLSGFHGIVDANPVYRRTDGSYYTILDQNAGFMLTGDESGVSYTQTLDNSQTTAIDDQSSTEKNSFKITIKVSDETVKILLKEMNERDELIKTSEFKNNDPETFYVGPETAYVIVEETLKNSSGNTYIKRSIYTPGKNSTEDNPILHQCNFPDKDGVIGLKSIEFKYQAQEH